MTGTEIPTHCWQMELTIDFSVKLQHGGVSSSRVEALGRDPDYQPLPRE